MAYSYDDHILDHINENVNIPYVCYKKDERYFKAVKSTLNEELQNQSNVNINNVLSRFSNEMKNVREDLEFIGIEGISLDVRINNGYDFHDFDVSYDQVEKVIDYYFNILNKTKKL